MIPDRRFHTVTVPFGANYGANIWGLDPAWITDPAARIAALRVVANTYGGARRIIHLPQGSYQTIAPDFNNYPLGMTLQPNVAALIAAWTVQPGEVWGVYTGSLLPMNPLGDLFVTGPDNIAASTEPDAAEQKNQLTPFTSAGFVEVWCDAQNDVDYLATHLPNNLPATVTKIGGEALPVVGGAPLALDPAKIDQAPWLALHAWFTQFNTGTAWTVEPLTTECHVWMGNDHLGAPPTVADAQSYVARGFIPGIIHGVTPAAVCQYIMEVNAPRSRAWMLNS